MRSSLRPTVVLVHGAWHGAWCYAAVQAHLDQHGIASLAVDLPGHGSSLEPLTDLHGDAAHLRQVVQAIDTPVVLVGHSYGGAVIGEAAADCPNVTQLVFIAAYVVDVGEGVTPLTRTMPPSDVALNRAIVVGPNRVATINPELATAAFYANCPPLTATASIARLDPQLLASLMQPVAAAAWKTIPSTYVRCLQDQAVALEHQDFMAQRCSTIYSLDTDHSPFVSMSAETAAILAEVVERAS